MDHQSAILGGGLASYEEGLAVDSELVLSATTIPRPFDRGTWEKWTLKSGLVISEKLKAVARIKGHPLR